MNTNFENLKHQEDFMRELLALSSVPLERCSQVLISQLAHMPDYGGMNSPYQFVEQEILYLERGGKTSTKPATFFKKNKLLKYFQHKHFFVPGYDHFSKNALLASGLNWDNDPKFYELVKPILAKYAGAESLESKWELSGEIASRIVGELESRLNGSGTGDWLIFTNYNGKNYYLCIARHTEEDLIVNLLKHCNVDFPFIDKLISSH